MTLKIIYRKLIPEDLCFLNDLVIDGIAAAKVPIVVFARRLQNSSFILEIHGG